MRIRLVAVVSIVATLFSAVACSSARDERCTDPGSLVSKIATQLQDGIKIGDAAAVKSNAFANVYMVAIHLKGSDDSDVGVGVWASGGLDGTSIDSVDAFASEFSAWPKSSQVSTSDDGVEVARSCVG